MINLPILIGDVLGILMLVRDFEELLSTQLTTMTNSNAQLRINVHEGTLFWKLLTFQMDPASDLRLMREAIEAHYTGDKVTAAVKMSILLTRLR